MKILITGGNGYIAKSIYDALHTKYNITKISRTDFDLTDCKSTSDWFINNQYDVVIHTAIVGGSRIKANSDDTVSQNVKMIYNLHQNRNAFSKLISFGSGAELFSPNTLYGLSKRAIAEIVNSTENWHNLRIFGVFDHNELETRFIKGNILRYIKKEPMIIHSDKIMDFYYMKDLISLIDFYIKNTTLPKTLNCSYEQKYTLTNISNFINTLDNYKVPVTIESPKDLEFYCGSSHKMPISEIGLQSGIINTFNHLKDLYNDSSKHIK
jgi:GDP-L-fucose synthase